MIRQSTATGAPFADVLVTPDVPAATPDIAGVGCDANGCLAPGQPALPVGLHTLGFVAATDEEAVSIQWPHYQEQFARIGEERGWSPPTYEHFLAEVDHGSMYVGSPETVARRIAEVVRQDVTIEDGKVSAYRVRLNLSFKYESS